MNETSSALPSKPVIAPTQIAHWVLKTPRREKLIAWYGLVFGAKVVHASKLVTFLSWDAESHRLALVNLPAILRLLFPLAWLRRKMIGLDHIAHSFDSLEDLLLTYERVKQQGIEPVWCINHGPTTSLYYEDPDGNRHEFQVENFATAEETRQYFNSPAFAENPIGVNFDPDYLLTRLRSGTPVAELLKQGAGIPPGSKPVANMKAITWRTL